MSNNRVIFSGSREFPTSAAHHVLDVLLREVYGWDTVIHGDAKGLDAIVDVLARACKYEVEPHPADWRPNGILDLGAGTRRNREMAQFGARLCIAFLQEGLPCKGTRDMIKQARLHQIAVLAYELTQSGDLRPVEDLCYLPPSR